MSVHDLTNSALNAADAAAEDAGQHDDADDRGKASAATTLVEIAEAKFRFGSSDTGEAFAVPLQGPRVVCLLRGNRSLRSRLAREYFSQKRKAAPQQALADALLVIEGMAQENDPEELHLRVAEHQHDIYVDLGDDTGRAVRIADGDWSVVTHPPMLFKRTALTGILPAPERGGSLDLLWSRMNICKADRPLVIAWLMSCFLPDIPKPVLSLKGEQGTGKSTAQKRIVQTIDPSPVPLRKPPRDAESWVTAAAGSWVVALDNLSDIPAWLSDSICRAVTGDGDIRRKLYTDGEHHVFAFRRCVILNGIDIGSSRGDLAERMLPIDLDVIPEHKRMTEAEAWEHWEHEHPLILGALLRELASVASVIPSVRLGSKPRMADFARVLAAVDQVHGTNGLQRYLEKQNELSADSLAGDAFIVRLMERGRIEGTASDLLESLTPERPPKGWPGSARAVTQRLRRHAPSLRRCGWHVADDGGRNHRNSLVWTLAPPIHPEIACNSYSQDSQDSQSASYASVASQEYGPSQDDIPNCPACDGEGCRHCEVQS